MLKGSGPRYIHPSNPRSCMVSYFCVLFVRHLQILLSFQGSAITVPFMKRNEKLNGFNVLNVDDPNSSHRQGPVFASRRHSAGLRCLESRRGKGKFAGRAAHKNPNLEEFPPLFPNASSCDKMRFYKHLPWLCRVSEQKQLSLMELRRL